MTTVRLKHSILAVRDQLLPVDLHMWSEHKLTEPEIISLRELESQILNYLNISEISMTIIKERIDDQDVDVGYEAFFPNWNDFKNTDIYQDLNNWAQRMRDDPDIRIFNWIEEIN